MFLIEWKFEQINIINTIKNFENITKIIGQSNNINIELDIPDCIFNKIQNNIININIDNVNNYYDYDCLYLNGQIYHQDENYTYISFNNFFSNYIFSGFCYKEWK